MSEPYHRDYTVSTLPKFYSIASYFNYSCPATQILDTYYKTEINYLHSQTEKKKKILFINDRIEYRVL